jgi:hypothetical protein
MILLLTGGLVYGRQKIYGYRFKKYVVNGSFMEDLDINGKNYGILSSL